MYKLCFYVPKSHLENVKNALFNKGAGRYQNYDCCAWQTQGSGQYRPLKNAAPFKGDTDQIQREEEYLVEMVCPDKFIKTVINELKKIHPYETPAYSAWKLELFNE